jgi:hypothetical protein
MKGELAIMDTTGDTKVMWDSDNKDEVETAKETFLRLKKKGYIAYTVKGKGEKGEIMKEFDPNAERIVMTPPAIGG